MQTLRRGTERSPYYAFESGVSITRMDRIENFGKFVLAKQGVRENWQITLFVAATLTRSASFALRRDSIAEPQIYLGEPCAD